MLDVHPDTINFLIQKIKGITTLEDSVNFVVPSVMPKI